MLIKSKSILTMIAVAGITVMAGHSQAATIVNGDLIFGFRVSSGTGAGTDVLIRANPNSITGGNAVTYRDATGPLTVANISAELAAYFGSSTRSDINWAVVGSRTNSTASGTSGNGNVPGSSPFVGYGQAGNTPGVQNSSAPVIATQSARTVTSNAIGSINTLFSGATADAIGSAVSVTSASSFASGWSDQIDNNAFFAIGGSSGETAIGNGLDLYWILNTNTGALDNGAAVTSPVGTGVYQGSFAFNSGTGDITFTPNAAAAIPEPSRALLAGLGLGGLLLRRRRPVVKTA